MTRRHIRQEHRFPRSLPMSFIRIQTLVLRLFGFLCRLFSSSVFKFISSISISRSSCYANNKMVVEVSGQAAREQGCCEVKCGGCCETGKSFNLQSATTLRQRATPSYRSFCHHVAPPELRVLSPGFYPCGMQCLNFSVMPVKQR